MHRYFKKLVENKDKLRWKIEGNLRLLNVLLFNPATRRALILNSKVLFYSFIQSLTIKSPYIQFSISKKFHVKHIFLTQQKY
ncbi:hypothetical protein BpHYR1_030707 [Brachionus plicatilis]|uniref:Uncharacterized protein n=1 Tax=Brachionus plicatilis TaxID=10195 RepID=A0A3M7PJY0_BRAPC|nr:hypothetical protein BpHYR1_030707 [Brachionus plicatilis]